SPGSSTYFAPAICSALERPAAASMNLSLARGLTTVRTCTAESTDRTSRPLFLRANPLAAPGLAPTRARAQHLCMRRPSMAPLRHSALKRRHVGHLIRKPGGAFGE